MTTLSYKISGSYKNQDSEGNTMNKVGLFTALFTVALTLPPDADARGRFRSSRSSAHAPATSHQYAKTSYGSENYLGASMRSSTPRYGNGNHYSGNASSDTNDYPAQPRLSPEMEAEYANIYAKKAAAHKARLAADEEKQIQLLEQATIRASEEQKRRDAEAMIKNREFAMLDRQKRQAAWEARCQIKPVMSDEEITTCKEVWSKPAR